jgi:AsmA family protein
MSASPRRWWWPAAAVALAAVAGFAVGESLGWPLLAGPLERQASKLLQRQVRLSADTPTDGTAPPGFRVQFLGGLHLQAPQLMIAAPDWSQAPHLLQAQDVDLELRYIDLWHASRGGPLQVRMLKAASLDAVLERRSDGRASWQFGSAAAPQHDARQVMPVIETLLVPAGQLTVSDQALDLTLAVHFVLADGTATDLPTAKPAEFPVGLAVGPATPDLPAHHLQLSASGRFGEFPVKLEATTNGLLHWVSDGQAAAATLNLNASVGQATFEFQGSMDDPRQQGGLRGRYRLSGPSLAAVGDPIGVTLPTTAAFRTAGRLVQQPGQWQVLVDDATVGASQLTGAFSYTTGGRVPMLAGRLGGRRLLLADLAPAVGVTAHAPARPGKAHKVLPDRPFDLAALRVMDANVLLSIAEVDLNNPRLVPLRPLHGHIQLSGGVLRLTDLDARTGQGRLRGDVQLDGRGEEALWQAQLAWNGVQLDQWIRQPRDGDAPPYIAGRLKGRADLAGQGRSTAGILASLSGQVNAELRDGAVSHLAMEAGGLDLAQGLGVLIKGDDALKVNCAVASLVAEQGVFRPKLMVLDTADSTVLVDGMLSLASETLDLRAVVTPKDFSPLALRAPLRVSGSFSAPSVGVDGSALGLKAAAAVVLAFINPLAALIPLIDPGDAEGAAQAASACQPPARRAKAKPAEAKAKAKH